MEDALLMYILIHYIIAPMVLLINWKESTPRWLPIEEQQTFTNYLISPDKGLTILGNIVLWIIKLGAIPSVLAFKMIKLLFIKDK